MTYLENLHEEMIKSNRKALDTSRRHARKHRDGKAWDNVKRNTRKRMAPRGPFFKRFEMAEHSRVGNKLVSEVEELLASTKGE